MCEVFNRFDVDVNNNLNHLKLAAPLRLLDVKPRGDQRHAPPVAIDANHNGAKKTRCCSKVVALVNREYILSKLVRAHWTINDHVSEWIEKIVQKIIIKEADHEA